MCEFNKDDVLALVRAILMNPIEYCENTHVLGNVPEYFCNYCSGEGFTYEKVEHELNCPVLIAQDISTGYVKRLKVGDKVIYLHRPWMGGYKEARVPRTCNRRTY